MMIRPPVKSPRRVAREQAGDVARRIAAQHGRDVRTLKRARRALKHGVVEPEPVRTETPKREPTAWMKETWKRRADYVYRGAWKPSNGDKK